MTLGAENRVAAVLRDVAPRPGFAAELLTGLTQDPSRLHVIEETMPRTKTLWIVAGAVAGVVSATGAVYLSTRRRHKGVA